MRFLTTVQYHPRLIVVNVGKNQCRYRFRKQKLATNSDNVYDNEIVYLKLIIQQDVALDFSQEFDYSFPVKLYVVVKRVTDLVF
jgi:phage gp36-like protein